MAESSKIEWTDATWNPITGCTLVSEGCRHCYAAQLAATRLRNHPSRVGLARINANGEAKFTGEVRLNEQWLDQPLRWRRPRRIFVCAHGDLFHEAVQDEWIDKVFAIMALAPHHTFQVLTKRPERLREYLSDCRPLMIARAIGKLFVFGDLPKSSIRDDNFPWDVNSPEDDPNLAHWPLSNVWLGTSVEDQATADVRIPHLIDTPAAVRFVSAEPLLGPVDLTAWLYIVTHEDDALLDIADKTGREPPTLPAHAPQDTDPAQIASPRLDWVIAGGESGRRARPMHPDWVRKIRDDCADADVPFLFKQWGEWEPNDTGHALSGRPITPHSRRFDSATFTDGQRLNRVGKPRAGRVLDGTTHNAMPLEPAR